MLVFFSLLSGLYFPLPHFFYLPLKLLYLFVWQKNTFITIHYSSNSLQSLIYYHSIENLWPSLPIAHYLPVSLVSLLSLNFTPVFPLGFHIPTSTLFFNAPFLTTFSLTILYSRTPELCLPLSYCWIQNIKGQNLVKLSILIGSLELAAGAGWFT